MPPIPLYLRSTTVIRVVVPGQRHAQETRWCWREPIAQRHVTRRLECRNECKPGAAALPHLPPRLPVFRDVDDQSARKILHERAQKQIYTGDGANAPEINLDSRAMVAGQTPLVAGAP